MSVVLYSTGCPKCNVLKKKLDAKKIVYSVNDSVEEMLQIGITQVPVLCVDGKLLDFKPASDWINEQ